MNNKMYMGLKLLFTCTCYSLNVDVTGHYFYINTTIPKKSLMLQCQEFSLNKESNDKI